MPGFIILLGLGISGIRKLLTSSRTTPFYNIIKVAILLLLVSVQAINLWQLRQCPDNRLVIYEVVGEWLRDHTPPDASVGTL